MKILFSAVIWTIWLQCNKVVIKQKNPKPVKSLAAMIISIINTCIYIHHAPFLNIGLCSCSLTFSNN